MVNQVWSWILAFVGIIGLYLAGKKNSVGWLIGTLAQALWVAYAITTRQWGFLFTAFFYAMIYTQNYIRWRREDKRIDNDGSQSSDD